MNAVVVSRHICFNSYYGEAQLKKEVCLVTESRRVLDNKWIDYLDKYLVNNILSTV